MRDLMKRIGAHRVSVLLLMVAILGLLIGWRDRRAILYDDVGITLRYAWRLAEGDGWTYNDGDRTNGASSPLYTFILAVGRVCGFDLIQSAKLIGVLVYSAVATTAAFIALRIAGFAAGAVAAVVLLSSAGFRTEALSGMETGIAVLLGLLVVASIVCERDSLSAVFMALMILNKLDAALLAIAVVPAWWFLRRTFPLRQVGIVMVMTAPWFVFSWAYFGSPLPHSMTQKASGNLSSGVPWNPTWILDRLRFEGSFPLILFGILSLFAVPFLARRSLRLAAAVVLCFSWSLLHLAAFSLIDMGDTYPWYVGSIYAPLIVVAAAAATLLCDPLGRGSASFRYAGLIAVSLLLAGVGFANWGGIGATIHALRSGHSISTYEQFERTRLDAGEWLAENAVDGEVISTCWGWVAYGAEQSPIEETCPLSTRKPVGAPFWIVESAFPGTGYPAVPAPSGWTEAVSFRSNGGVTTIFRPSRGGE